MKKGNFLITAIATWLLAMGSLIGVHSYMHRRPRTKDHVQRAQVIIQSLDGLDKMNIARHETALLRLADEGFRLIGSGYEKDTDDLASSKRISVRKVELRIADLILAERQWMTNEAFRSLNAAEKKCMEDGFAAVVFRNGDYYLVIDSNKYMEYVSKYGTECKTCNPVEKR